MLRAMAVGGGTYSAAGFAILMVLPYLGFFLLPMLLKNALAALGKIGGALTAMGERIRSGAQTIGRGAMKVAQNSEAYKDMQKEADRRRQEQRVNRIMNRVGSKENLDRAMEEAQRQLQQDPNDRRAQRRLRQAQWDQRRLYEAQQNATKLNIEQEMANQGAVVPSGEVIAARATSAREAQELKNYEDQYKSLTRAAVGRELSEAVNNYNNGRNERNRLRLQSAIAEAERRGMDKEMLSNSGIGNLRFSTDSQNNPNDMRLLNALAGSNNVAVSQFGKQMGKYDGSATVKDMSLNNFVDGADNEISLKKALDGKGPNSLNGVNDDILEYLNTRSDAIGQNVVSASQLVSAGAATTSNKEQTQLIDMINRADQSEIKFNGQQLAKQSIEGLTAIANKALNAGQGSELYNQFISATNDIANSPDLMTNLTNEQKAEIHRVRIVQNSNDTLFLVS